MKKIIQKQKVLKRKIKKKKSIKPPRIEYNFKTSLQKVFKEIFPSMQMSKQALLTMNLLISEMFELFTNKAVQIMKSTNKTILTQKQFESALNSLMIGDLQVFGIQICRQAIKRELNYEKEQRKKKK